MTCAPCDTARAGKWRAEAITTEPYGVRLTYTGGATVSEEFRLADAPALVEALMARGQPVAARIVRDAWFVALAHKNGFTQFELGGG